MEKKENFSVSLTKTLKESNLTNVAVDIAEVVIDTTLKEGVLREVPILGTLVNMRNAASQVKDTLFLKKVLYFINEVKDIPAEEREEIISEIDNSEKYRLKLGDKLLYILDKADDHEKSMLVGKFFRAFLKKDISYDTFLKGSIAIDKCIVQDLEWFLQNTWENLSIEESNDYINWGLFEIEPLQIKIKDISSGQLMHGQGPSYKIEGGKLSTRITVVGKDLRKYLK